MKRTADFHKLPRMWSVRLAAASAGLAAAEASLPLWSEVLPDGVFAVAASLVAVAAAIARGIHQDSLRDE